MSNEALIAAIVSAITALMGGGLLGAIFAGMSTRSAIRKTGADALETYQRIANIASESLLASQLREKEAEARYEAMVEKLESEAKIRSEENTELKQVISTWSVGIKMLHNQLESLEHSPRWRPDVGDWKFLKNNN